MKTFLLACAALGALPGIAWAQAPAGESPQAAPAAPKADPARMEDARRTVQAGWARYDKDNKGTLDALEFGTWVMTAISGREAHLSAAKVLNETSAAFARADTDHDRRITRAELTAFLGSGA